MSTLLHRVTDNFVWRIESLTPTCMLIRNQFEWFDPNRGQCPNSTGGIRKFYVEWRGSDGLEGATDVNHREAWHSFRVVLHYPKQIPLNELQEIYLKDRHDIIKDLRDTESRAGYKEDPTADIGVMNRIFDRDVTDETESTITKIVTTWNVQIWESEL